MFKKLFLIIIIILITTSVIAQQKVEFNNTYGSNLYNYGINSLQDKDNGYFLLSNTSNTMNGNTNIHIIRTDSTGVIQWEKSIGDTSIYSATDFKRTYDRGFIITGYTNKNFLHGYDVLLVKTDSLANVQWMKIFGSTSWDFAYSVMESKDTSYVIAGKTYGFGARDADAYIIKTNRGGDTIWTKVMGGDSTDYASSVVETFDGTYLFGANTKSKGAGDFDAWIINMNIDGDTIWTRTYGGVKEDILYTIINTPDSAFAFCGSTRSDPAINLDCWFVRTLRSGWVDWNLPQTWTIGSGDEAYFDVKLNKKNQYALAGYTTTYGAGLNDLFFMVMGEHYDFICSATFGGLYDDDSKSVGVASDSTYYLIGNTEGTEYAVNDILFIKLRDSCKHTNILNHITAIEDVNKETNKYMSVFPNPTSSVLNLQIGDIHEQGIAVFSIYNILGQKVLYRESITTGDFLTEVFDLSGHQKGLYFVRADLPGATYSSCIILK